MDKAFFQPFIVTRSSFVRGGGDYTAGPALAGPTKMSELIHCSMVTVASSKQLLYALGHAEKEGVSNAPGPTQSQ